MTNPFSASRRALLGSAAAMGTTALVPGRASAGLRIIMNDASRLDPTPVMKHVIKGPDPKDQLVAALRSELKEAKAAKRPVIVGAARHSMGGQSLPRDGTAITLDGRRLEADTAASTYRVEAGARWADVIAALDPLGFSPKVMQSNNDFGVASTFSVNAHGWPAPHGPFGSTVRSLRMLLADGTLITCSRGENADLFASAMGGYGLFGIIIDLDVDMTRNLALVASTDRMAAEAFADRFVKTVTGDPLVRMAYGRLSLTRKAFFDEALMVVYRPAHDQAPLTPAADHGAMTGLTNDLYRSQIGYEPMKALRWRIETRVASMLSAKVVTRNTLMNEPVSNLANDDDRRTDILHEYFVPPDRFGEFLTICRDIIPNAKAEFINVTLRYVDRDPTARMAFAPAPRIAAVMSFSQAMTTEGEIDMMAITERLIDGIVGIGGAFYLPYRLHARRDQVAAAYPGTATFVATKRDVDADLLFRNAIWTTYFA